jgi:DNA-binding FadR family transcriptional regulator
MQLRPIEPQRLYRQISEQLRQLILEGKFPVGTRLPAERELASKLDVSRPSVREALIALEVEGWVEVRSGSGVFVLRQRLNEATSVVTNKEASAEWGPLELIRARRLLEGEIVAIVATSITNRQLDLVFDSITLMREDAGRAIPPLVGDRAFHTAIANACANTVLIETVQRYWDARHGEMFTKLGGYFETDQSWQAAINEHQSVYLALKERNPTAARKAMHTHLDNAHNRFSASWRSANVNQ